MEKKGKDSELMRWQSTEKGKIQKKVGIQSVSDGIRLLNFQFSFIFFSFPINFTIWAQKEHFQCLSAKSTNSLVILVRTKRTTGQNVKCQVNSCLFFFFHPKHSCGCCKRAHWYEEREQETQVSLLFFSDASLYITFYQELRKTKKGLTFSVISFFLKRMIFETIC